MNEVTVTYFAMLKEAAGKSEEKIMTASKTVEELYSELGKKYKFFFPLNNLAAAINDAFVKIDSEIKNGDKIVFIPPVAGG